MEALQERMVTAMQLRNFSPKTIAAYTWQVKAFSRIFGRSPAEMGEEEVRRYLHSLVEKKASWSAIRTAYSALRFLYRETLEQGWTVEKLPPVKREKRLPVVLSPEEVKSIFDGMRNVKHRTVLMTTYSAGLRVSEVVGLRVTDIDSKRMLIRVEQGKGKKDRYTLLSPIMLDQLRVYWRMWQPTTWLFPGRLPGTSLATRTVQKVFEDAKKKPVFTSLPPSTHCVIALPPTC